MQKINNNNKSVLSLIDSGTFRCDDAGGGGVERSGSHNAVTRLQKNNG
jgi:hypothetical protein